MSFTVLQISDTHLSPRTQRFRDNNRKLLPLLAADRSDAVIHTGDITLDGIRFEEDYSFCRETFAATGRPIRFLAGNHDIGDHPALSQPVEAGGSRISAARHQRFLDHFGPDSWAFDTDHWRVIGLSSMLAGSGLDAESRQFSWLDSQLSGAGARWLAVFSHQPLFIDDRADPALTYWTVDPQAWPRLGPLLEHPRLRLLASGHLHQQRSRRRGAVAQEWCSSIAFTTREALVPEMGGRRNVGYMAHRLNDDGSVDSQRIEPAGFDNDFLDDCLQEVYPKLGG